MPATVELLESFDKPVLVLHARGDSVIPFALGRELYERLSPPKRFAEIDGGDHNDLFDSSRQDYWKPILAFIGALPGR